MYIRDKIKTPILLVQSRIVSHVNDYYNDLCK